MAYVKISPQTKRQALEKIRAGMAIPDTAKMFGISPKTLKQWAEKDSNSSLASTPLSSSNPPKKEGQDTTSEDKTTLDFEASPAPVDKKGVVDSALSSLKGMLGIADKKDDKATQPVFSAKLDARRQQFVDSAAPTLSLAFMALASWLWGRIGPEYSVLAPDEKVAERIVTPLLRIYARHANFMTDVNPDVADVGASMFALVGYVHVSLKLYQEIKAQKEADNEGGQTSANGWRVYRTGTEGGAGNEGDRYAPVQRASGGNGSVNGSNDGYPGSVNRPDLTDKEARQFAALSRLRQLDYEHRARRSSFVR